MNYLRFLVDRITRPFRVIFQSPLSLFSKPARVMGLSLPVRLALFALLILVVTLALSLWIAQSKNGRNWLMDRWEDSPWIIVIGGLLLVGLPWGTYQAIRFWLEAEPSPFEHLEKAWNYGVKALRDHGIELSDAPLFLVTGVQTETQARAFMHASGMSFSVNGVPEGPAALHWFANDDAIFLVLTEVSHVGLLSKLVAEFNTRAAHHGTDQPLYSAPPPAFMGTYVPSGYDAGSPAGSPAGADTVIGDFRTPAVEAPQSLGSHYGQTLADLDQLNLQIRNPAA
ncbi:MAG: hypothetical protein KF861_07305, partial [Planctomycetaceae bacterium]|nr:hypothetical protein [Planctomycetaceae bacterium]